jgi:hypothetical protein
MVRNAVITTGKILQVRMHIPRADDVRFNRHYRHRIRASRLATPSCTSMDHPQRHRQDYNRELSDRS